MTDKKFDQAEFITEEEAKSYKRVMKKSKVVEYYESMLKKLESGQAGKVVAKEEQATTIKNRVVRIAKSLDMNDLKVKRTGDTVTFWREGKQTKK